MSSRKSKKHREPTPEEEGAQALEAAAKAGADYAHEQVNGDHFRDWVYEQVAEAERMRRQDPGSVFPSDTPDGAKRAAKNMLQQLEWDTERQMDAREILELSGASGVFGAGSADWVRDTYGITQGDVTGAFFSAFREALRAPAVRQWLADMVLETNEHDGEIAREARRSEELPEDLKSAIGTLANKEFTISDLEQYTRLDRPHIASRARSLVERMVKMGYLERTGRGRYFPTRAGWTWIEGQVVESRQQMATQKELPDGTRVSVQAQFEHRAWTGTVVGRQGPPGHEVFRLLIKPDHGGASLWRRPSEITPLSAGHDRVDPQTWAEPRRSEMRDSSEVPTERQILDFFIFDAEDADLGTFSRAKTDEVAAHFRVDPAAMFRALDALAERGVLKKTRDLMKRHRGKTAFGYQWWEYNWTKADLARWEDREQEKLSERRLGTRRQERAFRIGQDVAMISNPALLGHVTGFDPDGSVMVRWHGGAISGVDPRNLQGLPHGYASETHRVRDYVPTDSRGRPLSPPTKDYEKAKREADRMGGVVKFKVGRPGAREPSLHGVRDFDSLASLVEHARDQGGATHVIVLGKHASLFYPSGRYWPNGEPQYEAGKVWQKGGYWHTVAPSHRTALSGGLPGGTEPIEAYLAGKGARVVRDYVPTDTRGRPVSGPTKDYEKAKRDAARAGGVVKFLPGRKPVREVPRSGRVASSRRPQRRRPVPR